MKLQRCVDCGKEISLDAWACPNCGAVGPARRKLGKIMIGATTVVGAIFVIIAVVISFGT